MSLYLDLKAAGASVAGDATNPGYEGQIKLQGLSHSYMAPMSRGAYRSGAVNATQVSMNASLGPHAILIWKALVEDEEIEATVTFDPSDDGDDPEWSMEIKNGKIGDVSFGYHSGGALSDNSFAFSIAFNDITLRHESEAVEHQDNINI